jgi:long-subunit acyl-CoA synthetase (AMP-forming)
MSACGRARDHRVADESEARAGAEKLAAIVVPDFDYLKREKIANSKEAIRHDLDDLGRSLPEYQRVRDYMIRAEPLPRTATRKIKRFQLKQSLNPARSRLRLKSTKPGTFRAKTQRCSRPKPQSRCCSGPPKRKGPCRRHPPGDES